MYHRKIILEMLRKGIHLKEDGRFNKESYIHNLIYPMRRTSEDIEYESHNFWLIVELDFLLHHNHHALAFLAQV